MDADLMLQCGKPVDVSDWTFNAPAPVCAYPAGHEAEHPCGARQEHIGEPCRFCGVTLAVTQCPACWTPIPANLADQKALFASIGLGLEKTPAPRGATAGPPDEPEVEA